ncbi:poly-beta-1,6-N-acetyl-D-glucosamine biosynthesis protein PgaD [Microbacteriaceae bacterium 4G12]
MGKSGQRHPSEEIIIVSRRFWIVRLLETVITVIAWLYLLATAALILCAMFEWDFEWKELLFLIFQVDDQDIQILIYKILILSVIFLLLQFVWVQYNYRAFGGLKRRKFPQPVEAKELAEYFSLTEEEILDLQEKDIIELKEGIV